MSWCEGCSPIHGEGCTASYRDRDSRKMCVFCLDGVICPIQKRILAPAAAAIATRPVIVGEPTIRNKIAVAGMLLRRRLISDTSETQEEDGMAVRMCSEPGCDKKLSFNNTTGRCQLHGGGSNRDTPSVHGKCTVPGCAASLAVNNSTGLCKVHEAAKARTAVGMRSMRPGGAQPGPRAVVTVTAIPTGKVMVA